LKRQYLLFIHDILEAIQMAEEFVGAMSYEEFLADAKTKNAVVRQLEVIGEATKHIPSHIRRKYPHIPWSSMAKTRDRLAHGYWTVDYEIVWKVLKEEFPELKPQIREVYENEQKRS